MEEGGQSKEAATLSLVRPDLASVHYKGVESIETIAKEIGLHVSQLVKLGKETKIQLK